MFTASGSAQWQGDARAGRGRVSTQSGSLRAQYFAFGARFEGKPGATPEELIGAAHAACFAMTLARELAEAGIEAPQIEATATVTLEGNGAGPAITRSDLRVCITAEGDEEVMRTAARTARDTSPVSRLMTATITMDLTFG